MRLILIGCEYSGGTTMALAIGDWILKEFSASGVRIHDHWVYPDISDQDPAKCFILGPGEVIPEEGRYAHLGSDYGSVKLTEERAADVRALKPWILEQAQRIMVWRHMHPSNITRDVFKGEVLRDSIEVGLHYPEAVYAPMYYGYGESGSFADRRQRVREWDRALLEVAPEYVLVLLRSSPQAIRERMLSNPRPGHIPRENDVEKVIGLFEEQYDESELNQKLAIQTSGVSVEESVAEFVRKVEPFLTDEDRGRRG